MSTVIVLFITCHFAVSKVQNSHIIGIPNVSTSHGLVFVKIGRELAKRGHNYTLVVPFWQEEILRENGESFTPFDIKAYATETTDRDLENMIMNEVEGKLALAEKIKFWTSICESLMENGDLLDSLRGANLVVCDIASICCAIVADYLDIIRVDLSPSGFTDPYLSFIHNFPSPVAFVPHGTIKFPKKLTFLYRMQNLMLYFLGYVMHELVLIPPFDRLWRSKVNNSSFSSLSEVFESSGLLLIANDFALEFPRPLGAHVKIVGPILPDPPKPLSQETETFVTQGHPQDLVLVSFGTVLSNFKSDFVETIAHGLANVSAKVIWKHKGQHPHNIGETIRIVNWMKQNDLLGHPSTKVFLTHGGLNSILEGAYHGTPMVVLPLFGDQSANAMKVYEAGIGVVIELEGLTPEVVSNALTEVLKNTKYKESAERVSKRIRLRRVSPAEEACDWIEYGLYNNAGLHLRSQADNLCFFQLYLLDVLFVTAVILLGLSVLFYFSLKFCIFFTIQFFSRKVKIV
ncbi:2-hydroxyacylsphingosine 1-beta-galactosyltransferase-like [Montipora foliosa]|uniref:2-hydroxyacylsphingosine 1-beta-galactosyltransferase-like n=1 Tax=Montipora foliosa TaxID=591990 RepID=UPI0035F19772